MNVCLQQPRAINGKIPIDKKKPPENTTTVVSGIHMAYYCVSIIMDNKTDSMKKPNIYIYIY